MKLTINKSANEIMQQHAIELFPDECCGFLYGHETDESQNYRTGRSCSQFKRRRQEKTLRNFSARLYESGTVCLAKQHWPVRCLSLASATSGDSFRARFETSHAVFFLRHFIRDGCKNSRHQKLETQRRKHDFLEEEISNEQ
jgi:hypothetical protein